MVQTRNDFANDRIRNAAKKLGAYVAFSSEMLVSLMFAPSFYIVFTLGHFYKDGSTLSWQNFEKIELSAQESLAILWYLRSIYLRKQADLRQQRRN